jgi:CheY-like chemotaxis protein
MKNNGTPSVEESTNAPIPDPKIPRHRILLADDDPHILELNTRVLICSGYDVDTAADGADAWKALKTHRYDLLITDNKMPRVTGLELIKKLRSEGMTLPVILASGTMPTEELKRHPWLQLDPTLPKPFTSAELLDMVKKVLGAAASVAHRNPFKASWNCRWHFMLRCAWQGCYGSAQTKNSPLPFLLCQCSLRKSAASRNSRSRASSLRLFRWLIQMIICRRLKVFPAPNDCDGAPWLVIFQ